jgi:hypothetical protein
MESPCCVSGCSALNLFYFTFLFLVCGDQLVEQYSRFYLTKDVYAMLLVCSFFIWRFLLKNPNNFCAFDVMLFMCAFHVMSDEFAEDCILYSPIRHFSDCEKLQNDLDKLAQWEQQWDMQFHSSKCNSMSVTRSEAHFKYNDILKGHTLDSVDTPTYLGITNL